MPDTIAAIATGAAISAIGIIRVSGTDVVDIIEKAFRPATGRSMREAQPRELIYGSLADKRGRIIDHCLCVVNRGPHSYTGEDTAELQCHGSPIVLREALEALFSAGARQAEPGEFTKRAFLNGRMDLTAAEAVIDLISAETAEAARNAASQLGGAILRKTDAIYNELVNITSHFHAILDYPDEEIEELELTEFSHVLEDAEKGLKQLLDSFERGRIMKDGIHAAIVGRPNAGKSSLLNALLGYERAIVTEIPGTTRDTIEEKVVLGGVLLRLTDTAGLRETSDPVERIGVLRAAAAASEARLVLAVFDGSVPLGGEDMTAIEAALRAERGIAVINKCDLAHSLDANDFYSDFDAVCRVSALNGEGIEKLGEAVAMLFPPLEGVPAGEILTNARQADAAGRALDAVASARAALEAGETPDIVLTEAEAAMVSLGELTGRTVRDDVTARIFERFCVGK